MHFDAEFYVALGFFVFVLVLLYVGVHKKLTKALDDRAHRVSDELAEAQRLRQEATSVLEGFRKRAAEADIEAAAIVAHAKLEAETLAKETEARMVEFVARRTKQAEQKISFAEAQAAAEVRTMASEAAVEIARRVFANDPKGSGAAGLLDQEIGRLSSRLN